MRRRSRFTFVIGTSGVALLVFAQTVLATCFGSNEGAWAGADTYARYGWKGETDLVYATPYTGATIVHPAQIISPTGDDFLGWGLYKGKGLPGTQCPDNFTTSWRIYIDGWHDGYFCKATYGTIPDGAQNQYFRIEYTTCPGDSQPKWVLYWNSAYKTCKTINTSHGATIAGAESVYTTVTQNLQVDYLALRYKDGLGNWNVLASVVECELDDPYTVDLLWNAAWDIDT
jgi:hypothetical protein